MQQDYVHEHKAAWAIISFRYFDEDEPLQSSISEESYSSVQGFIRRSELLGITTQTWLYWEYDTNINLWVTLM